MDSLSHPNYTQLINLLRESRKRSGTSQKSLAERLGIHQSIIAKTETRERRLDIVELFSWFAALDCDPCRALIESGFVSRDHLHAMSFHLNKESGSLDTISEFIRQIPYPVYLVDPTTATINFANPPAHEFYGYPEEGLAGVPLAAISLQAEQELHLVNSQRSQAEASLFRHRTADGIVRIVSLHTILIDGATHPPLIGYMARDISGEIQFEHEALSQKTLVRNLLNNVPYAIFIKDLHGRYIALNDVFAEVIGLPVNQILRAGDIDLFGTATALMQQENDSQVVETRKAVYGTLHVNRNDCGELLIEIYKVPLFNEKKQVIGIMGSFYPEALSGADLSKLHFSPRFREIFKSLPVPVCISRLENGAILETNDAFLALTALTHSEVNGRNSIDLGLISAEFRAMIIERLRQQTSVVIPWDVSLKTGNHFKGHLSFQKISYDYRDFLLVAVIPDWCANLESEPEPEPEFN